MKNLDINYVHPVKEHSWGQRVVRFYDPDCHIIEVGENYKLYLVLIDSAALGLTIAPDFVSVETDQEPPAIQFNSYTNQNSYQNPSQQHGVMGNDMPFFTGPAAAGCRPGTVGLDNSDIQKGGTEF